MKHIFILNLLFLTTMGWVNLFFRAAHPAIDNTSELSIIGFIIGVTCLALECLALIGGFYFVYFLINGGI